jgi:hypothetical protein
MGGNAMATIALVSERTTDVEFDVPSTRALLATGAKLTEFCRTDPADPKTARFDKLRFLLMNSGRAWNTLSSLTAGISSTWNPEPPKTLDAPVKQRTLRVIYSQKGPDDYDCSAILAAAYDVAQDGAVVVIIGCRESIQEMLIAMSAQRKFSRDSLQLVSDGFPARSGEMAAFDADSGRATLFDPRALQRKEEDDVGRIQSRALA